MKMYDTPIPKIPLPLVEWLEARQLARTPHADTATEAELRAYVAEGQLVRQLRGICDDQINPPADPQED